MRNPGPLPTERNLHIAPEKASGPGCRVAGEPVREPWGCATVQCKYPAVKMLVAVCDAVVAEGPEVGLTDMSMMVFDGYADRVEALSVWDADEPLTPVLPPPGFSGTDGGTLPALTQAVRDKPMASVGQS